jgi:hypothetical protein
MKSKLEEDKEFLMYAAVYLRTEQARKKSKILS